MTIDDNEGHYLKVLMDEVFGRGNFVNTLIWKKADSPRNSARQFSSDHDYVHLYARKADWKPAKLPRTDEANAIYANPDDDERGPWLPGDPYANKPYSKGMYTMTGPSGGEFSPPPGRFWRVSEERLRQLDSEGRVWWGPKGEARPSIKRFLNEVSDLVPRTLWRKDDVGSNRTSKNEMRTLFPEDISFGTPKPERLLERVIHIATNPNDLVLDSFLGSGTTAAVAHKMGRRWIGIEMGEHAVTHCLPRWVAAELQHPSRNVARDVTPAHLRAFVLATVRHLVHEQRIPLEQLARHQYPLVQRLALRVAELRDRATKAAFTQLVLDGGWTVEASAAHAFAFDPACYPVPANKRYRGKFRFAKHFYPVLSDPEDGGEEWRCALAIDEHPAVRRWARNLDSDPVAGFWLPTSSGRFYPDFVCELNDGRLFVAEYKGEHLRGVPKEIEKGQVGRVWAEHSAGRCAFAMLFKLEQGQNIAQQIDAAVR